MSDTYIQSEKSQSRGKPRELYRFEGTYGNYYYTSQQDDVEYDNGDGTGPHVYEAFTLKRSNVKIGTHEDDGLDLTVEMPVSLKLVQDYAFQIAPPKLKLTVYRYHTLAEVKTSWAGPVLGIKVSKGLATIRSPSILSNVLTGSCPSVYYQTPCNRILFDEGCKVSRNDNTVNTRVRAVSTSGTGLSVLSDGGRPDGFFNAGEVLLPSGERRMIIGHVGNIITINFPFSKIVKNQQCQIVAGCDHAYNGDCKNKFNNQPQFGGFVFIPNVNPFVNGIG